MLASFGAFGALAGCAGMKDHLQATGGAGMLDVGGLGIFCDYKADTVSVNGATFKGDKVEIGAVKIECLREGARVKVSKAGKE